MASAYDLRDRELSPVTFEDPFSDMNTDEKSKLLVEFMNQNNTIKEFVEMMKAERSYSRPNDPHTYGSKTQKRKTPRSKAGLVDHAKDQDDFDGTPGSIGMDSPSTTSTTSVDEAGDPPMANPEDDSRIYRQGMEYQRMKAEKAVCHRSDFSRRPAGAKVIKVLHRYYRQLR